jgi:hypothetical protein
MLKEGLLSLLSMNLRKDKKAGRVNISLHRDIEGKMWFGVG